MAHFGQGMARMYDDESMHSGVPELEKSQRQEAQGDIILPDLSRQK